MDAEKLNRVAYVSLADRSRNLKSSSNGLDTSGGPHSNDGLSSPLGGSGMLQLDLHISTSLTEKVLCSPF
jgi:hypothetical protein